MSCAVRCCVTATLTILYLIFPVIGAEATQPILTVVLEENSLLARHWMGLHVWINNPTAAPMTDVRFSLATAEFIKLGKLVRSSAEADSQCEIGDPVISLGEIGQMSALELHDLCIKAEKSIEEQDINLAFNLAYSTRFAHGNVKHDVIIVERKLSIGLFGTDSVSGISLRLLTLFFPGLLLLIILRAGNITWLKELSGTDVAALSIVVSVGMAWLASNRLDIRRVSDDLFLLLCAIALLIGMIWIGMRALVQWVQRVQEGRRLIDLTDQPSMALVKALHHSRDNLDPVVIDVVTEGNRKRYIGALAAPAVDGHTALLGWFELKPRDSKLRARIDKLLKRSLLERAVKLARRYKIEPAIDEYIKCWTDGDWKSTAAPLRIFVKPNIDLISHGQVDGLDLGVPLKLG